MEERTYWLSFTDPARPAGQQFLGVCLVDIDEDDAEAARNVLKQEFPNAATGAEWIAAAIRMAHLMGCNPGGEVGSLEIPTTTQGPRNRLLSREEALAVKR